MKRKALIQQAKNGQWYYELIGDNGKTLVTSETMKRKRSCEDVVKKYFPDFKIVDLTK